MKLFRKEEGFTLVELMVVVLIIGILVAIAIPVFNTAKANSQKKSCFANQRTIDGACESYYAEYDAAVPDGAVGAAHGLLVAPNGEAYLKAIPGDPGSGTPADEYATVGGEVAGCPNAHGSYQP